MTKNNMTDGKDRLFSSGIAPYFPTFTSLPKEIENWVIKEYDSIIIVCDLRGNIVYVSDSIEKVLGYTKEDFYGHEWKDTLSEQNEKYLMNKIEKPIEEESFTLQMPDATGKEAWLKCVAHKIYVEEFREHFLLFTYDDITQLKHTEEYMIRAEKMSVAGQLALGITHEIRNPLTALKGFLQLLQSGTGDKDTYYRIMMDELTKIEKITSELLHISKPMTHALENHSVYKMMADIVSLFRPHASTKGIEIKLNVDGDLFINCDQTQIKQAFINLLKNAIEVMDKPGTVTVEIKPLGKYVQIDVIDEGPGIDESISDNFNEPFVTTKKEGTGLGLVITNQIIDRHEGYLEAFSNETSGSTFSVRLPINE